MARLRAMDRRELRWRARAAIRAAAERARFTLARPRWDRRALAPRLDPALDTVQDALARRDWNRAHRLLSVHLAGRAPRFVVSAAAREPVVRRVLAAYPGAAEDAAARGGRLLAGEYDLLGYEGLRFPREGEAHAAHPPAWALDPVHGRTAPSTAFWASIPYLDPQCGDHKIIWELNRHQHWLALGRAYWLTGDDRYRRGCLVELASWLSDNPPLAGINWASMLEVGFRSLSWIWALEFFVEPSRDEDPWTIDLLLGLDRQLTHVERNLSRYFSPNTHLLGEALALYVSGRVLPELVASPARAALGRSILLEELQRQVGADGGHLERSTHYHRYALDFYLLALAIARITHDQAQPAFEEGAARLARAGRLLADETGLAPHLGDDDGGRLAPLTGTPVDDWSAPLAVAAGLLACPDLAVGPPPEEACWWLSHPALGIRRPDLAPSPADAIDVPSGALPDTGYYVSRSAQGDHLVIDGGAHGYLNGGHAHADALSITLSLQGRPVLVDAGTGAYTINPMLRDRFRSTQAHNTVVVDGQPQSSAAGPFHWARAAATVVNRWRANDGFDFFDGSHDGYRPIVHRRRVLALHADLVIVADCVRGSGEHAAAAHWHVHPSWTVTPGDRSAAIARGERHIQLATLSGELECFTADRHTGLGWHSPVYGRVDALTTVRIAREGLLPLWIVTVFGLNPANGITAVEAVPVWSEAGALSESFGVRVVRRRSTDVVAVTESIAGPAAWRLGELETDAAVLFFRTDEAHQVTRVALVDGSFVHAGGRGAFALSLPRSVPDLHLDLDDRPRLAGAAPGARLVFGGREHAIDSPRRSPQLA